NLKIFLLGAVLGVLIFVSLSFIPGGTMNPLVENIVMTAYFPGQIVILVDNVLYCFCDLFQSNACDGLPFDGSSLEWIEWTSIIAGMAIWYGVILLLGAKLIEWYTKRKHSKNDVDDIPSRK